MTRVDAAPTSGITARGTAAQRARSRLQVAALMSVAWICESAQAQAQTSAAVRDGFLVCTQLRDTDPAKLQCYNAWAASQARSAQPTGAPAKASFGPAAEPAPSVTAALATAPVVQPVVPPVVPPEPPKADCKTRDHSLLVRTYELLGDAECPKFSLRGMRPTELGLSLSDSVNALPNTPAPLHAAVAPPYQRQEARIQVSVRSKVASGLLLGKAGLFGERSKTDGSGPDGSSDALWFGYTSQSYWQVFNGNLSRPFRTTDHEPELFYIRPLRYQNSPGWHWRYAGAGLVHHSNGLSLPLSRSWNRTYLSAGLENTEQLGTTQRTRYVVEIKAWRRAPERAQDDDNPDMSDFFGRAEVAGRWHTAAGNYLGVRVRHSLKRQANGSTQIGWYQLIGDRNTSSMFYNVVLSTGFGSTLLDYNRKKTVLSTGLTLLDW